jgi:hypothetical protein
MMIADAQGQLREVEAVFRAKWTRLSGQWKDSVGEAFASEHMQNLDEVLAAARAAVDDLNEVVRRARKVLADR